MNEPIFTDHNLPRFHPHKLILTLPAAAAASAAAEGRALQGFARTPLAEARNSGLGARFTPLGHAPRAVYPPEAPMPFLTGLTVPTKKAGPLADLAILQLRSDVNEEEFAEQLLADPLVRSAAPVPGRPVCLPQRSGAT